MRRIFFFNDTATTEIYTLSLHDALPISSGKRVATTGHWTAAPANTSGEPNSHPPDRSEEHTSELQSRQYLVCRLLLEKKNIWKTYILLSAFFRLTTISSTCTSTPITLMI